MTDWIFDVISQATNLAANLLKISNHSTLYHQYLIPDERSLQIHATYLRGFMSIIEHHKVCSSVFIDSVFFFFPDSSHP